jgi:hypothetical protein
VEIDLAVRAGTRRGTACTKLPLWRLVPSSPCRDSWLGHARIPSGTCFFSWKHKELICFHLGVPTLMQKEHPNSRTLLQHLLVRLKWGRWSWKRCKGPRILKNKIM